MGCPASPFIGEGKVRVTEEEKGEEREGEGFKGCWVLLLLHAGPADPVDVNQGRLYVTALFITSAMRRHHLPVMAFHSIPVDIVVN